MADVQQTYKFKFEFDRKDVKKQLKEISTDVKDAISQIGDASDKVVIFKELVSYLSNVDKALDAFKTKHKDDFSNIFGNPDKEILGVLIEIFNTTQQSAQAFATLKDKIAAAESGKAELSTLRGIAEEINELFVSIGQTPKIDINEMFIGKGSKSKGTDFAGRIKLLNDTLAEFGVTYFGFQNKLKGGFSFGSIGGPSKIVQEEIEKLEKQKIKLQTTLDALNGLPLSIDVDSKSSIEEFQKILDEYRKIQKIMNSDEYRLNSGIYKDKSVRDQIYAERIRLANLIQEFNDYMLDKGTADDSDFATVNHRLIDEAIDYLNNFYDLSKEQTAEIRKLYTDLLVDINDQLSKLKITPGGYAAEDNIDTLGKKIVDVSEYVSALSGQLKEMFTAAGRSANFEYHIAIDGLDIKARHGSEKSIDLATQTETYLDTLFSDSVLYGHSHRGGTSLTNIQDIESVLSSYRDGIAIPVHFVIGKDSITTMDFTSVSKDVVDQLMQEIAATNSNKNAPVINENINKIVEKITGKSGALKTWNVDQFDDLAQYLYDVSSAASSALTPIEKFQAVLDNMFGRGKVDATKYGSLLSELNQDNAKSIFNQIASMEKLQPINTTDMLTMGQVNAEIDESIAKYKALREEANLSYSDIRNEVDKVIEHYNSGGSATRGLDFFQQYFPEGEWQNVRNLLTDAYDNLISLEEVTNRIANEFGIDPDTFAQIPNAVQTSQIDQAKTKLESFFALSKEIQDADLLYFGDARDNVAIGRYIESLETSKNELYELWQQGVLTTDQFNEMYDAFDSAKRRLDNYTQEYSGYGYGDAYSYEVKDAEEAAEAAQKRADEAEYDSLRYQKAADRLLEEKAALEVENELLKDRLAKQESDDDELSDIQRENGALEDKLEILREIADTYGVQITQKDRNRYEELNTKEMEDGLTSREEDRMSELSEKIDEADSNLLEFEQTYDRITLKLSNGKKVEILPDDDGLRKLYKIADSYDNEYNGFEIEDVIFKRKQENAVVEATNNALQEQLNIEKQISDEKQQSDNKDAILYDSTDGQLAFFDNILQGAQRAEDQVERLEDTMERVYTLDNQTSMFDENNIDYEQPKIVDESKEIAQLEVLKTKLLEVRSAVDAKTQAFEEEYVTVDAAVESEIAALQELSNKLEGIITKVGLVEVSLKNIGNNSIQLNVSDSEEQLESLLTSSDITKEMAELEKLQGQIIGVKDAVLSKTKAFVDEGNVVGQVVGKEISGLIKLEGIVNNISKKISELVQNITTLNQRGINFNQNTDVPEVTTRTPEEQFKIDKTAQKGALTKYLNDLKDVDYVADDLRKKLNDLPDLLDIAATPENLSKFKEIFADIKKEVDAARRGFEEREGRGISSRKNALYTSFNALNVEQQKKLKDDFDAAINKLQEYEAQIKAGKRVELDALEAAIKGIREKIEAQAELNKAAKDAEKTKKKNSKFGDTTMVNARSKYNSLDKIVHSDEFNKSDTVMKAWDEYDKRYKHLEETRERLSKLESITGDDEAEFKAAKEACNEYAKSLNKILNNSIKLSTERANKNKYTLGADFDYNDEKSRKDALADFVKTEYDVTLGTENFKKGFKEAMFEVNNGDGTMTKMTAKFTEARNEIVATAGDVKKVQSAFSNFIEGFKGRVKSLAQYFLATISIYDVWRVIKQGIQHVREIDSALTELKKVTDETDASYDKFLQDMSKTGAVIGATVKDLTTMAADWSRLGYSMEEAGELAKSTAILLNVSEFKDATEASEALISTMQAFQYTADESQHVVDVLNEVGNNFAVSSDGIATALQDSASALMEAGNNLEQSVALVAAANKVVDLCHAAIVIWWFSR